MTQGPAYRPWLLAMALCAASVLLCICCLDRPAADLFEAYVRPHAIYTWLNRLLAPLVLVPLAALLFQFGAGLCLLLDRPLAAWTRTPMLYSSGTIWAISAEFVFKQIFGRGSPNPTYLAGHLYGFRFLHASEGWSSFPSGTATVALTIATTTWLLLPRWRAVAFILAGLVCIGVTVTNGHWISDVLAGIFLGLSIGWMTVAIFRAHLSHFSTSGFRRLDKM